MAKKISQLTQATEVKSDDVTVIVQDGETKKLPLNMMVTKQDIENKKVTGLAKLDEIEATYENDTYTPTITVKNKSSVKVGEGDEVDYSANVMDGHVKSAILKGQTLVNVETTVFPKVTGWYDNSGVNSFYRNAEMISMMKPNTDYLVYIEALSTVSQFLSITGGLFGAKAINLTNGKAVVKATTTDVLPSQATHYFKSSVGGSLTQEEKESIKLMIIEYQNGMENWDIPYFDGMQSVKLPVLTTMGVNIFEGETERGYIDPSTGQNSSAWNDLRSVGYTEVIGGNTIRILVTNESFSNPRIYEYDENKNFIGRVGNNILSPHAKFVRFCIGGKTNDGGISQVMLYYGDDIKREYEPYKSNILSTPNDLVLGSVGDVHDTLDLLTGEVVESTKEIALDGSESDWYYSASNNTFRVPFGDLGISPMNNNEAIYVLADRYNSVSYSSDWNTGSFISMDTGKKVVFRDERFTNLTDWKNELSKNPITVRYQLATESIKTVDLIPSGTHPSTTPYCWKDGHIQLSSSGLLPSLEYSVVTSRAGQISQNAAMIVKNDKRIFDLEILLAGGLVNTTYQALTLQNQVETGLSKVSLSSETEPDYLLYHMIMKLIDEKAYKLDDLAEKVSVFYLYEKLSDEQFETIYAALYPFVEDEYDELPEDDEIIEEPIVDEVLEEVENEVVM